MRRRCHHSDNDGLKPTRPVIKRKVALLHAKQAQGAGSGIDLTVLDPDERDQISIVQEAGWAPGPV
jgi:hypothetical protein